MAQLLRRLKLPRSCPHSHLLNAEAVGGNNGDAMDKMIARLNISHYKMKVVTEQDEAKRQILLRLLAEEEAKLVALDDPPKRERREN